MAVLLGLCDEPIPEQTRPDPTTNKIGGTVVSLTAPLPPPACPGCDSVMSLVLQLCCPLDNSPFQRALLVFACCRKPCQNLSRSWRVLRCQRLDPTYQTRTPSPPKPSAVFNTSDWCDEADDWGDENDHMTVTNQSAGAARDDVSQPSQSADRIASNHQHTSVAVAEIGEGDSECISEDISIPENTEIQHILKFKNLKTSEEKSWSSQEPFSAYYVSAVEEPPPADEVDDHVTSLLREYEKREGAVETSRNKASGSGESYEKSRALHGDDVSRKFMKRVARCPQQCLRYSWQSEPLLLTPLREPVPLCPNCSQKRTFEFQLMPAIISHLTKPDSAECVDFGTVLIFSCENSCWKEEDVCREELCVVQADPDNELFF